METTKALIDSNNLTTTNTFGSCQQNNPPSQHNLSQRQTGCYQSMASSGFGSNQYQQQPPQQSRSLALSKTCSSSELQKAQLPFSLENCFLMEQTRLLIVLDGQTSHEVDSIVECRGHSQEQQFKLEMCCQCCSGRRIQLNSTKLLQVANEPLRDLAMQTIQMHREGLDISGHPNANNTLAGGLTQDDFDMDGDDEEDFGDFNGEAMEQPNCQKQPSLQLMPMTPSNVNAAGQGTQQRHLPKMTTNTSLLAAASLSNDQEITPTKGDQLIQASQGGHFIDTTAEAGAHLGFIQVLVEGGHHHELKELHDYDDEEFNMNEQSEEGTAVDCDSQGEVTNMADQGRLGLPTKSKEASMGSSLTQQQRHFGSTTMTQSSAANESSAVQMSLQSSQMNFGLGTNTSCKRPSLQEFDDDFLSSSKRQRLCDQSSNAMQSGSSYQVHGGRSMKQHELARNFSSQLEDDLVSPSFLNTTDHQHNNLVSMTTNQQHQNSFMQACSSGGPSAASNTRFNLFSGQNPTASPFSITNSGHTASTTQAFADPSSTVKQSAIFNSQQQVQSQQFQQSLVGTSRSGQSSLSSTTRTPDQNLSMVPPCNLASQSPYGTSQTLDKH